jgi:hypothetical protein
MRFLQSPCAANKAKGKCRYATGNWLLRAMLGEFDADHQAFPPHDAAACAAIRREQQHERLRQLALVLERQARTLSEISKIEQAMGGVVLSMRIFAL